MKIPHWYIVQWAIWLCTGLPFQWLFTAFYGLPFFSLPGWPVAGGSSLGLWVFSILLLYHPFLMTPVALWQSWMRRAKEYQ